MGWFADFSTLERGYALSAILGGVLLCFRLVLMALGAGDGGDVDVGDGADDFDFDHADAADSSFRLLSLQGLMSFFLMFGLVGLGLSRELHWAGPASFGGAASAGMATMVIIGLIYLFFERMQSSGNIVMQNAVGREGSVYLTIPADGTGQIQVSIQGRLRVEDALTDAGRALPTGTAVRVTGLRGTDTLVVAPLEDPAPAATGAESASSSPSTAGTKE